MAFTEDLAAFFSTDDFAVAATYNGATPVNVIFDRAYLASFGIVSGANPVALCAASAVAADPTGKTLQIGATVYTIRDCKPQDDGATVLLELSEP